MTTGEEIITGKGEIESYFLREVSLSQTKRSGAAVKVEEYVPESVPIRRAATNQRVESPPMRNMARSMKMIVMLLLMLLFVAAMALATSSPRSLSGPQV